MGYIVDLIIILDVIFKTSSDKDNASLTTEDVKSAMNKHVDSGRRDRTHQDIHAFVAQTVASQITEGEGDLVMNKITGLIWGPHGLEVVG